MKRIGFLLGRRIRGDIELGLDPTTQLPGEIIAPGNRIIGRLEQDIYVASDDQNYLLGTRRVVDDRIFRYARAGNALHCGNGAHLGFQQDVAFAVVTVDVDAAGTYELEITVAITDGRLGTGEIPENELAGGYIIIWPDGMEDVMNRKIVSNTERAAPGGAMTIVVDRPLSVALTPAPHAECIASPYLDVLYGNYGKQMIMGMPSIAATGGQYFWLQTWGPCWAVPGGVVWDGPENTLAMFDGSGSIEAFDEADPVVGAQQIAGHIMAPLPGGGSGAPFLWLMIAP